MRTWVSRFVDVRPGEWPALVQSFVLLLLMVMGHTTLETARDSILLTQVPAREIAVVYIAVAICVFPAAALASRMSLAYGVRRTLIGGLLASAVVLAALFGLLHWGHVMKAWALAIYVTSALVSAILLPLFWNLVAAIFTVAEGRRLLGPIGSAGSLGGTVGAVSAAGLLLLVRVETLLLFSAAIFVGTAFMLLASMRTKALQAAPRNDEASRLGQSARVVTRDPFLVRMALLAIVSTAVVVLLDYFLKWSVARNVPHEDVPRFIARYYAGLNVLSLGVQLFVTNMLVRRAGVANSMVLTPLLLLGGGVVTLLASGALIAVVALRALQGALVGSVHRVVTELTYLSVPTAARARSKPFIDGPVVRLTQAAAGAVLLALGSGGFVSARRLAALAVSLIAVWLISVRYTYGSYFALLRRGVASEDVVGSGVGDLTEQPEVLVPFLADEDPLVAVGAVNGLARRKRADLMPALILLHEDERVLVRALAVLSATQRKDWIARAGRLLRHPRESVRMAAARALAMHGALTPSSLAEDTSPRVRSYAIVRWLSAANEEVLSDPRVEALVRDESAEEARLGMLSAIQDSPPNPRLSTLLAALGGGSDTSPEWNERFAGAVASQRALPLVPLLISRLRNGEGSDAIRAALVSFGRPAIDLIWAALTDPTVPRSLRSRLPKALAYFGTPYAAELLLQCIEREADGLVRYKALRALGRAVSEHGLVIDRARIKALAYHNLREHFRIVALLAPFQVADHVVLPRASLVTERLLTGLLADKARQSLERTFRLLKIAYPREDIHRVYVAALSGDFRRRANASEFLDTLLHRRADWPLRDLLRIATDTLSVAERAARAASMLGGRAPMTRQEALAMLVEDSDTNLKALAVLHAASVAGTSTTVSMRPTVNLQRSLELTTSRQTPLRGVSHA